MSQTITDNIDDLQQLILDTVEYYEDDVPKKLARLVSDIRQDLKAGKFKDRTGALRRSMRVKLVDYNISISMKPYGYFLSFGVKGKTHNKTLGLAPEVATRFGKKEGGKFGSSKVWGIDARKFYPTDIEEQLMKILLEE